MIEVWVMILEAVPSSRFLLKNKPFACPAAREHVLQLFVKKGIAAHRIDLLPLAAANSGQILLIWFAKQHNAGNVLDRCQSLLCCATICPTFSLQLTHFAQCVNIYSHWMSAYSQDMPFYNCACLPVICYWQDAMVMAMASYAAVSPCPADSHPSVPGFHTCSF